MDKHSGPKSLCVPDMSAPLADMSHGHVRSKSSDLSRGRVLSTPSASNGRENAESFAYATLRNRYCNSRTAHSSCAGTGLNICDTKLPSPRTNSKKLGVRSCTHVPIAGSSKGR